MGFVPKEQPLGQFRSLKFVAGVFGAFCVLSYSLRVWQVTREWIFWRIFQ